MPPKPSVQKAPQDAPKGQNGKTPLNSQNGKQTPKNQNEKLGKVRPMVKPLPKIEMIVSIFVLLLCLLISFFLIRIEIFLKEKASS